MPTLAQLHHQYQNGIPCPPDFNFATHVVDKWALHQPPLLALHWVSSDFSKERKLTYADLAELSERAAVGLARLGIKKGERVLVSGCKGKRVLRELILRLSQIQLPRVCEWWIAIFALMRIGAVPVPGTTLLVSSGKPYRCIKAVAMKSVA